MDGIGRRIWYAPVGRIVGWVIPGLRFAFPELWLGAHRGRAGRGGNGGEKVEEETFGWKSGSPVRPVRLARPATTPGKRRSGQGGNFRVQRGRYRTRGKGSAPLGSGILVALDLEGRWELPRGGETCGWGGGLHGRCLGRILGGVFWKGLFTYG